MAAKNLKRSNSSAQPKRRRLLPHLKLRVYETLYHLNRGFTLTLMNIDRMERLGIFRNDYLRAYRAMSEEIHARANTELLTTLQGRETKEAVHFQNARLKWERRHTEHVKKPARKR